MTNSARKGRLGERDVRDLLTSAGIKCRLHGIYETNDLTIEVPVEVNGWDVTEDWPVEVKRQKNGFATTYKNLEGRRLLFQRADNKDWLVTLRASDFLPLLGRGK